MSDTIVDMPKVTQMLDAGWQVFLSKNEIGTYTAVARHPKKALVKAANRKLIESAPPATRHIVKECLDPLSIDTDDFTPEQALTRLAYKVHGEVL